MIRKYFYPQRYNMSLFEEDGETVSYKKWIHLDHCIDTLRQSLMCNADVAAQGFDWFQELHYIRVRIDTVHRCRNFDRIRDWAWERAVPWNSHMAHVDEKTGRVIDYGFVPDPEFVHEFTPENFHHTKDDM
jgi:Mycotoxin biosynthesis protein UstYa